MASYLRYLYKYPQKALLYDLIRKENVARTAQDPPFSIMDTGIFEDEAYFHVFIG